MEVVFLDNAATTPLEPRVKDEMVRMMENFGNPSSTHVSGRGAKVEVEVVRKRIAQKLGAEPGEIFFTSGGTEADNMALFCSVRDLGVKRIISTAIEHHAVGHPIEFMEQRGEVEAAYLNVNEHGDIDLAELEALLQNGPKTLVSLMFANNEIGNLLAQKIPSVLLLWVRLLRLPPRRWPRTRKKVEALKQRVIDGVKRIVPDVKFFGRSAELDKSLYTVLSIAFPKSANDMLTFSFDMKGINVSGGSACTSGSNQGSHVIRALGDWTSNYQPVRVSFSKFNTEDCVDAFLNVLEEIYAPA
jgi:cysteine sulfinate desulfinase/cysteine desulfurase-like protein